MATVILSVDPSTHLPWAQANSCSLVRAAVRFYETLGRGALVLVSNNYDQQTGEFTLRYTADRARQQNGEEWFLPQIALWVQTYDPTNEFVLVLVLAEDDGAIAPFGYGVVFVGENVLRFVSAP
jgi:hypothetical protein